jgi:hypothetical protein
MSLAANKSQATNSGVPEANKSLQIVGGYLRVPNFFIDELLPVLPFAHLKVLLFMWRKTYGWKKLADYVPLSQIEKGTGLSRKPILAGLSFWVRVGLFMEPEPSGFRGTMRYRFHGKINLPELKDAILRELGKDSTCGPTPPEPVELLHRSPVDLLHPQKKLAKATNQKTTRTLARKLASNRANSAVDFPTWLPKEQWNAFLEMRRVTRHPLSLNKQRAAIRKLDQLRKRGYDPAEVLSQGVIRGGWFE